MRSTLFFGRIDLDPPGGPAEVLHIGRRTGPMRDIVSTIQPEQDAIVRSDLPVHVCARGHRARARPR